MAREDVTLDVEIEEMEVAEPGMFKKAVGALRSTFMVGFGTLDLAQEKVSGLWDSTVEFVSNLEERGENYSEKRREQLNDQVDRRQEQLKDLSGKASDSFDKYSEVVLTRVNIPTSDDIEGLSKQVNSLSRKVDKVSKE